ncbi:hypothetical protein CEXT_612141 [Caerostris extrusa]|uniref:Uncharacterized protein n=1 Tax=Caerostris extrusa TaxID=172846 RepID=A0AAV4MTU6_CAEEX|nr:hypothetical protein CEXT_612141 [Caerostris extrusa]
MAEPSRAPRHRPPHFLRPPRINKKGCEVLVGKTNLRLQVLSPLSFHSFASCIVVGEDWGAPFLGAYGSLGCVLMGCKLLVSSSRVFLLCLFFLFW